MKRVLALSFLIIVIVVCIFAYKSMKQPVADKDGNQLRYTYQEIMEENATGIFVLNEDNTFSPAITSMPNFQGATDKASPERFVWYSEATDDVSRLIPTVTRNGNLVAIFNQDGELSESHYLEKYKYKGYTIGAHIALDENKNMHLFTEECLKGSQAAGVLTTMAENTNDEWIISEISGSTELPINNVDPNMGLLLGLQENKLYEIKYYHGTKEDKQVFKADTKVFQSEKYIPLPTPYKKTDKGFFIINLPENLSNGYYYISDMGFFAIER